MRSRGRDEVQFGGVGRAAAIGVGGLVRTTKNVASSATFQDKRTATGLDAASAYAQPCVFDGTNFIRLSAGGVNSVSTSTDGYTWTVNTTSLVPAYISPIYDYSAGAVLATFGGASVNCIYKSTNHGVTWSVAGTLPSALVWYTAYGAGRWIAVPYTTAANSNCVYSDDNGTTWNTGGVLPATPAYGWRFIIYANGLWLAQGEYDGVTLVSRDGGATWVSFPAVGGGPLTYSEKFKLYFLGDAGAQGRIYATIDGKSAFPIKPTPTYAVSWAHAAGNWVGIGDSVWSPSTGCIPSDFWPQTYGNGRYVVPNYSSGGPSSAAEPVITYSGVTE